MEVKMNREAREDYKALNAKVQAAAIEEMRRLKKYPEVSGVKHMTGRLVGLARV